MSLRRNILANYASQIYATLVGIATVPLYVRYMGTEVYGLVGFFSMLQAWFQLLDVGLTPTLSRETARFSGGAVDARSLRQLFGALENIFLGTGAFGLILMIGAADLVVHKWLQLQQLQAVDVRNAVMLMAGTVALRWVAGLYRGVVTGFEQLVWLSKANIAIASARFVFVLPILIYVGNGPVLFFAYQLVVALFEILILRRKVHQLMPPKLLADSRPRQLSPLLKVLRFSLSIAFTSSVWIVVTQTDKLILSKLLPLSEYGFFTLAIMLASGVLFISTPVTGALSPRMTKLYAAKDDVGLLRSYREATQLVCVIAIPVSLTLAVFAKPILWAWTGRHDIASSAAPVLTLYSLGYGILAVSAFPSHLQFAIGRLRMHVVGNLLFVAFLVPALIFATIRYGSVGAGIAWLTANMAYFVLWVPAVHNRFIKGAHWKWLLEDVLIIAAAAGCNLGLFATLNVLSPYSGRLEIFLVLAAIGFMTICAASLGSSFIRRAVSNFFRREDGVRSRNRLLP